jgi:hypothetical protein
MKGILDDNISEQSTPKPEKTPQRTLLIRPDDRLPSPPDLFSPGRISMNNEEERLQKKLFEYQKIKDRVIKIEDNSVQAENSKINQTKGRLQIESQITKGRIPERREDESLSRSYYEESETEKRQSISTLNMDKRKPSPGKDLHKDVLLRSMAESRPFDGKPEEIPKKNFEFLTLSDHAKYIEAKRDQEEALKILNNTYGNNSSKHGEAFYEGSLLDIVDQVDQEELRRSQSEIASSVKDSLEQRYLLQGSELLEKRGIFGKGSSVFSPSHSSLLMNSQKVYFLNILLYLKKFILISSMTIIKEVLTAEIWRIPED